MVFDYDRDHPMLLSGTGPFTKMGLDNPDSSVGHFELRPGRGSRHHATGDRRTVKERFAGL